MKIVRKEQVFEIKKELQAAFSTRERKGEVPVSLNFMAKGRLQSKAKKNTVRKSLRSGVIGKEIMIREERSRVLELPR